MADNSVLTNETVVKNKDIATEGSSGVYAAGAAGALGAGGLVGVIPVIGPILAPIAAVFGAVAGELMMVGQAITDAG
jgi:hypothetical protein